MQIGICTPRNSPKALSAVEERIILIRAEDADEALRLGEDEAQAYAAGSCWPNENGQKVVCRYLDSCELFRLSATPEDHVEIFSKMLFVPADRSDASLTDRLLGTKDEEASEEERAAFEPDFEAIAKP